MTGKVSFIKIFFLLLLCVTGYAEAFAYSYHVSGKFKWESGSMPKKDIMVRAFAGDSVLCTTFTDSTGAFYFSTIHTDYKLRFSYYGKELQAVSEKIGYPEEFPAPGQPKSSSLQQAEHDVVLKISPDVLEDAEKTW